MKDAFVFERPVRFEDVDVAGVVFFARFLNFCHEAMEAFFGAIEGGYSHLVLVRKIGFPAVHFDIDYRSPLRYGETASITVDITKLGNKSVVLHYSMRRKGEAEIVAEGFHTCVVSDLVRLQGIFMPDDIRAHLEAHLVALAP